MSLYGTSRTRRVPNQDGYFTPNRTTAWRFLRGANGPVKTKRRYRPACRTRFAAGAAAPVVTVRHPASDIRVRSRDTPEPRVRRAPAACRAAGTRPARAWRRTRIDRHTRGAPGGRERPAAGPGSLGAVRPGVRRSPGAREGLKRSLAGLWPSRGGLGTRRGRPRYGGPRRSRSGLGPGRDPGYGGLGAASRRDPSAAPPGGRSRGDLRTWRGLAYGGLATRPEHGGPGARHGPGYGGCGVASRRGRSRRLPGRSPGDLGAAWGDLGRGAAAQVRRPRGTRRGVGTVGLGTWGDLGRRGVAPGAAAARREPHGDATRRDRERSASAAVRGAVGVPLPPKPVGTPSPVPQARPHLEGHAGKPRHTRSDGHETPHAPRKRARRPLRAGAPPEGATDSSEALTTPPGRPEVPSRPDVRRWSRAGRSGETPALNGGHRETPAFGGGGRAGRDDRRGLRGRRPATVSSTRNRLGGPPRPPRSATASSAGARTFAPGRARPHGNMAAHTMATVPGSRGVRSPAGAVPASPGRTGRR